MGASEVTQWNPATWVRAVFGVLTWIFIVLCIVSYVLRKKGR